MNTVLTFKKQTRYKQFCLNIVCRCTVLGSERRFLGNKSAVSGAAGNVGDHTRSRTFGVSACGYVCRRSMQSVQLIIDRSTINNAQSLAQCAAQTKHSSYPLFTPFSLPISTGDVHYTASENVAIFRGRFVGVR